MLRLSAICKTCYYHVSYVEDFSVKGGGRVLVQIIVASKSRSSVGR